MLSIRHIYKVNYEEYTSNYKWQVRLVEPTVFNVPRYVNTPQIWCLPCASLQYFTLFSTPQKQGLGWVKGLLPPKNTPKRWKKRLLYFLRKNPLTCFGHVKWQKWSRILVGYFQADGAMMGESSSTWHKMVRRLFSRDARANPGAISLY